MIGGLAVVTISEALTRATHRIAALGSEEARLEAELLMMHALGADRPHLYQRLTETLDVTDESRFEGLVARRLAHEPVPYITGHREFFGLEFEVSPAALIPRPETETLVEAVVAFARGRSKDVFTIADVGTGAGVVAVALACELPGVRVIATDVSPEALELAERNAVRHGVAGRIDFRPGDLLEPLDEPVDVIAANLPYVTTGQWEEMPPEIREYEPRLALDGGADGLDAIRRLLVRAPAHLNEEGALFCEIGDWQGESVLRLAEASFPDARTGILKDLAGRDRVLAVYTQVI